MSVYIRDVSGKNYTIRVNPSDPILTLYYKASLKTEYKRFSLVYIPRHLDFKSDRTIE